MAPATMVRSDSLQITDQRIREAFSATPQLPEPLTVAVYSAGAFRTSLSDSIRSVAGVRGVYEIAPVLVEEDRYYRSGRASWSGYSAPPAAPLKELRYLAAQGHADLLVFFSATHRYEDEANWLAPTYALLLPAFFMPGRHGTLTTNVDVFFLDVRNGFLYSSYHDRVQTEKQYVTLGYEHGEGKELAQQHVRELVPDVVDAARTTIHTDRFYEDSTAVSGTH